MASTTESGDDQSGEKLTPYMRGFIDGVLAAQGILRQPSEEEFAAALHLLDAFVARHYAKPS